MISRKDFAAVAAIIRKYNLIDTDLLDLHNLTEELATYFKKANSTFDRGKFMRSAGWYQE